MTIQETSTKIIEYLGGKNNIISYTHCATRLRFNLRDANKADMDAIKKLDGVLGSAFQGGQHQVIIGPNVDTYYQEIEKQIADTSKAAPISDENLDDVKKKGVVNLVLDTLTSILSPIIPAFCAAGMLKVVLLTLVSIGAISDSSATYTVFSNISDVAFYFLPFLVAVTSAKRFKVNEGLAIIVAGALLYPSFINAVSAGESMTIFGINIPMYTYSSTIFPALLGVLLLSYVYKLFDKIISYGPIKLLLVPLLSILITVPLVYLIVAPLGNWGSEIIGGGIEWMLNTLGPIAGLVIGFFYPILVLTGLHQGMSAIQIMEVSTYGYTILLAVALFHNFAEAGASFGVAFASKDKQMKSIAAETGITAFIGVTEPALYTVMTNDRYAMLSSMIGCAAGGFFSLLFGLRGYAYVWPNFFSIPSFVGPESPLFAVVITLLITMAVAFIMPTIFVKLKLTTFKKNN
ncbi:PTS transporter subunit EIIC [Merdibacter massiliensis]|uniref:PTS transporter subunit EIIC n=1 Tax=Merdibacter massiliensis TaxID=1871030 RepID=UPI00096AC820|nr:PTS transporter subunit EIIC [Merdibacter massiliensis]